MSSSPINSSTTTLVVPTNARKSSLLPEKDYASALASLQSSYGVSGHAPVLPPWYDSFRPLKPSESDSTRKLPKSSSSSSRQSRWKNLLFHAKWTRRGSSDVVKCVRVERGTAKDVDSGDMTRASGAEPERTPRSSSSSPSDQKKDFKAAFAHLQTSYGIGVPIVAGNSH